MSDLSVYNVKLQNGMETQMRLSADDAKERGLTDKDKAKSQKAVVGELDDDFTDDKAQAAADADHKPVSGAKKAASSGGDSD